MRYLITGGLGFIGHTVVNRLVHAGHEVHVLDNACHASSYGTHSDAEIILADVADPRTIARIERVRPDVILHAAAQVSVPGSLDDPARDAITNVGGTYNVTMAAQRTRARLVFLSSGGAIYGQAHYADEETPPAPASPYGEHKLVAERIVASHDNSVSLRLSNVYGPGQEGGVIGLLTEAVLNGTTFTVNVAGQTRDFVHVDDVVDAIIYASNSSGLSGVYNVSTGFEIRIQDLPLIVTEAMTSYVNDRFRVREDRSPLTPGDVAYSSMNHSLFSQLVGWQPVYRLDANVGALI